MSTPLIGIGESIHASIPNTGQIMLQLHDSGPDAYTQDSDPLNYIRALIESQADEDASYIAVNLDAFGESDPEQAARMMMDYVRLVRKWGKGVPICIDSSDDNVLIAGLKEWYNTDETVKPPLINSIKIYTADAMMPLKKKYDFSFIGLLVSEDKSSIKRCSMASSRKRFILTPRCSRWRLTCQWNRVCLDILTGPLKRSRGLKPTHK